MKKIALSVLMGMAFNVYAQPVSFERNFYDSGKNISNSEVSVSYEIAFVGDSARINNGKKVKISGVLPIGTLAPSRGDLIEISVAGEKKIYRIVDRVIRWKSDYEIVCQIAVNLI